MILSSTHWPWIGDRTRQVQGAHIHLLSAVANPVACKIGPTTTLDELREVCRRLDPGRRLGRLALIARLGADRVERLLPRFVDTVRRAGHPVIWLCDPMHGNTLADATGRKTRLVEDIRREVEHFQRAVTAAGGVAGGLHLEATPDDVRECVSARTDIGHTGGNYTSLCDPRLNLSQAIEVVRAWRG
jgi:3-deoxy-7-phosphoheptulonate synthase